MDSLGAEPVIMAMLSMVHRLDIRRLPVPADGVTALALLTGLSGYDAAYLWLAHSQHVELVTLDRELARVDRLLRGHPA